ncbi:7824_t:CDS:2 [Acaulospora colombiana]|uniref:7824_t:CDS:1 n=1 Tax=Acaulospora colombiana TaxID=27376 RepID=A0ACA9MT26_9GLOM|nr:7824_t:CDS:2 [Acaulospora colombiana]
MSNLNNVDYDEDDAFLYGTLENETTTEQVENEGDNEIDQIYPEDIQDVDPLEPLEENGNVETHESAEEQEQGQLSKEVTEEDEEEEDSESV